MHNHTAEVTAHHHQAKRKRIASIDEMRRLSSSSSETIHCTPYTWCAEVAEPEDGDVEESRAVPFYYTSISDTTRTCEESLLPG
jgi:hypothetical protein